MLFVHALAIPRFVYQCDRSKPLDYCKVFRGEYDLWDDPSVIPGWHPHIELNSRPCTFALRDLAYLVNPRHVTIDDDPSRAEPNGIFSVHNPSVSYQGRYPSPYVDPEQAEKVGWESGLFLSLPLSHWEWKGKTDTEVEKKIIEAGFESVVLDY